MSGGGLEGLLRQASGVFYDTKPTRFSANKRFAYGKIAAIFSLAVVPLMVAAAVSSSGAKIAFEVQLDALILEVG